MALNYAKKAAASPPPVHCLSAYIVNTVTVALEMHGL